MDSGLGTARPLMSVSLTTAWDQVRSLRQRIRKRLLGALDEIAEATVMTASELVENTIKHGAYDASHPATLSLSVGDGEIVIEVSNAVRSVESAAELVARVERIAAAPDKSLLYLERMTQLMTNPHDRGGIGLYRIAYEGQFELQLRLHDDVVTVRATRRIR